MYHHLALGPDAATLSVGGSPRWDGAPEMSGKKRGRAPWSREMKNKVQGPELRQGGGLRAGLWTFVYTARCRPVLPEL